MLSVAPAHPRSPRGVQTLQSDPVRAGAEVVQVEIRRGDRGVPQPGLHGHRIGLQLSDRSASDIPLGMVRIGAIVLNVSNTHRAAEFWGQALGYQAAKNPDFLVPTDRGAPRLHLDRDDGTHLDLWAADEAEQRAEVERLVALGATRADWDYPDDADFTVLVDPDGNLFCVINSGA